MYGSLSGDDIKERVLPAAGGAVKNPHVMEPGLRDMNSLLVRICSVCQARQSQSCWKRL